jgi:hypothetical protein
MVDTGSFVEEGPIGHGRADSGPSWQAVSAVDGGCQAKKKLQSIEAVGRGGPSLSHAGPDARTGWFGHRGAGGIKLKQCWRAWEM